MMKKITEKYHYRKSIEVCLVICYNKTIANI